MTPKETTPASLHDKLVEIQSELKAPKNQRNSFGNYNYRSCEDILEAVKPLLSRAGLTLVISDGIAAVGTHTYVKATVTLSDGTNTVESSAFAREALERKGMDASQITGATSSYARKYALNGLFCIDDTKDADATNDHSAKAASATRSVTQPPQDVPKDQQPRATTPTGDII